MEETKKQFEHVIAVCRDEFYLTPVSTAQADSLKNLRAYADMYLWKAELSSDKPVLKFTYTTPDYLEPVHYHRKHERDHCSSLDKDCKRDILPVLL